MATEEFGRLARRGENGTRRCAVVSPLILPLSLSAIGLFSYLVRTLAQLDGDPNTYADERTFEIVGYPVPDFVAPILSFSAIWAGLYAVTRFVHRRPFPTLIAPDRRADRRRPAQGFGPFLALSVPVFLVQYLQRPSSVEPADPAGRFFLFVPAASVPVPIQAQEKLMAYLAARVARDRKERGVKPNHPEEAVRRASRRPWATAPRSSRATT